MKTKLLLILLLLGLQLNLNAQEKHDYKQGCCKLMGKIFSRESCYCSGCAEVDEKNRQAKEAEDKRVKAVIAKKEEEKRQKAIEEQKKQNEKLAEQRKKDKENVLHLGFPKQDKKLETKPEVEKNKIIKTESESYPIVKIEKGEPLFVDSGYKSDFVRESDREKYGELYKYKIYYDEEDVTPQLVNIKHISKGWYLAIDKPQDKYWHNPTSTKNYSYGIFHFSKDAEVCYHLVKKLCYFHYRLVIGPKTIVGGNKDADFILCDDKNLLLAKDNFSKKLVTLIKSIKSDGAQPFVIVIVNRHRDNNQRGFSDNESLEFQKNFRNYYYFDLKDKQWKILLEFPTETDWNNFNK